MTTYIKDYIPRLEEPGYELKSNPLKTNENLKYYTLVKDGGYSKCASDLPHKSLAGCSALYNCVGYAWGRFNEISQLGWAYHFHGNAGTLIDGARDKRYWNGDLNCPMTTGTIPHLGALIVWKGLTDKYSAGHVAVVEQIYEDGTLVISESTYSSDWHWRTKSLSADYFYSTVYEFQGFIYHPNRLFKDDVITIGTAPSLDGQYRPYLNALDMTKIDMDAAETVTENLSKRYNTVKTSTKQLDSGTHTKTALGLKNESVMPYADPTNSAASSSKGMSLLSSTTLVESPFIIAQIGDYTFGSYTKQGSTERFNAKMHVTYPNYMDSITIVKTDGKLNVYTLNMIYQIAPGQDPNLIDRILSTVSDTREITLSYGDWELPSFIYQQEKALITKVTSHVDFASQKITYQLSCTSTAIKANAMLSNFDAYSMKGSEIIYDILLKDDHYGLLSIFPGMKNIQKVRDAQLIPTDDMLIHTQAQFNTDTLTFLDYVVASMTPKTDDNSTVIKKAIYHLIIMDDIENEFGGAYFKIVKVGTSTKTLASMNTYEVDIGYPSNTLVTDFSINTDNSWSILYNYSKKLEFSNYSYSLDSDGNVQTNLVQLNPAINSQYHIITEADKTWWTKMTQFPITATLTIKGLLRPALLMTYVKVNAYFYGQRHISSGLYVITKQTDTINSSGYRTELNLTRVAGDDDDSYGYSQVTV